jgi:hypothetical protein
MRVEIDRPEYESLELHKLVRPTVGVTCGGWERGLPVKAGPTQS